MPSTNQKIPANTTLTPAQKEEMLMLGMTEEEYIAEYEDFERLLTIVGIHYVNPKPKKSK